MTYRFGGLIQAIDFNNLVGPDTTPSTEEDLLNSIWGTGTRQFGYGQSSISKVDQNELVQASDWANLINTMNTIATHQGTTISPAITAPATNDKIQFINNLKSNLTTLYTNNNNAALQGATQATTTRYTTSKWINRLEFTFTITFSTPNNARYFFNSGGQIVINCTHDATGGIDTVFKNLCTEMGSVVISSVTGTKTCKIAGTDYRGVTKVGGSGNPLVLRSFLGFYSLLRTDQLIFEQNPNFAFLSPGFREYAASSIKVFARTSGPSGSNGDVGSVITVNVIWTQSPATEFIAQGNNIGPVNNSTTTLSLRYPSSSGTGGVLTNTWGTATVTGRVSAY